MAIVAKLVNVSKHFGNLHALDSLTLNVHKGQAIALLGPNGAGKSTALNILLGLRQPNSGKVELFGQTPGARTAMEKIGVTPQNTDFPPQLTPRELLEFATAHFPKPHTLDYLVETFRLASLASRRIAGFSGGERRRVALAMCFAGRPELVILDEPSAGLDTEGQKHFQDIANRYVADGGALILTSHYWAEIENIANHIVMIDKGKTVMDGTISRIKSAFGLSTISFRTCEPNRFVSDNFSLQNGVWSLNTGDADDMVRRLVNSGQDFSDLTITPNSLEQAIANHNAKGKNT